MLVGVLTSIPARADVGTTSGQRASRCQQPTGIVQTDCSGNAASHRHAAAITPGRLPGLEGSCFTVSKPSNSRWNQLGQTLTTLEELKPQANEVQRMAIDNARPQLAAMAEELSQAINLLSDDRKSVYRSPYTNG